jgi:hypothetical protein
MAEQFAGLLWGNLIISLLLGVADPPNPTDIKRRARNATTAFLRLYPASASRDDPPAIREHKGWESTPFLRKP